MDQTSKRIVATLQLLALESDTHGTRLWSHADKLVGEVDIQVNVDKKRVGIKFIFLKWNVYPFHFHSKFQTHPSKPLNQRVGYLY